MKLKVLDLFSGIGGISYGLCMTGGFEVVAYCERDKWLRERLANWHPGVAIYDDVRTFKHDGRVDVVCGGDPCQPHSSAGRRKGKEDGRYLWPAMFAIIKKFRPNWVIRENVRGNISNRILDTVESDLESASYSCRTYLLPSYAVGAPHERFRTWTIANAKSRENRGVQQQELPPNAFGGVATNASVKPGLYKSDNEEKTQRLFNDRNSWRASSWDETKPRVRRMDDGLPDAVQRLQALGNSVDPRIPYAIGHAILQAEAA